MVVRKSPDSLPSGWTEQVKVEKGRKVKFYSNMDTRQKFYSKKDIIHYVEMGNLCRDAPQPKSKHDKRSSKDKSMPVAMETNETPEWLPHGWIMEMKTYQNGSNIGKKYKCYMDPITGCKFYSKPEVSEYLRTIIGNSCTSQQKKMDTGLPDMGELTGTKTPLKLEGSQIKTLNKTSVASKQNQKEKVTIERVIPDGLPPGWIKEIRFEKKANGIRKDSYYTDPVNGYVFRSQRDALRYAEDGDFNRCAAKPTKRDKLRFLNKENSPLPAASRQELGHQTTANRQELGHQTTRKQLFAGMENSVTSSLVTTDAEGLRKSPCTSVSVDAMISTTPTTEVLAGKHSPDNAIEECNETKENNDPSNSTLPRTKGSNRKQGKAVCAGNRDVSTPSEMAQGEKFAENGVGKITNTGKHIDSNKYKKKKAFSVPCRSSKRLAGLKPDMAVNSLLSEQVLRAAARKSGETVASEAKPSVEVLDNVAPSGPQSFETVSDTKIAHHAFTRTEVPPNVELLDGSEKHLKNQAVQEDQSLRKEMEKKDENLESRFLYPFGDSWSDPCLEFAFKTLTGEIPIDDNLGIQGMENDVTISLLETEEVKGSRQRQCTTVPADAMITSTSTIETLKGKHSLDNAIVKYDETKESDDPGCSPLHRTEGSIRKQGERICVENGTVSVPATEMVEERVAENGMGKITYRKMQIGSSKSKRKKSHILPCRSSKRLAGFKSEMVIKFVSSEQSLRAAGRKSSESETRPTLGALDDVDHSAPGPFETVAEREIANHTSTGAEAPSNVELSNSSKKPQEELGVPVEQPVRLEMVNRDEGNREFQVLNPSEVSWSDPCLEIAFKTLTGAIPVEDNIVIQGNNCVSSKLETIDAEGLQERQCTSVSADAVITSTPTFEILEGKHLVENVINECVEMKEKNDPSSSALPRTEVSKRKRGERVCAENGIVSTPSTEMVHADKLEENGGKRRNRNMQIDSSKSKRNRAPSLPCRSSKRLGGLKPDIAVDLSLSEHALRAAARKSGESEAKPYPGPPDTVAHGAPEPRETLSETEISLQSFAGAEALSNIELSNGNKKLLDTDTDTDRAAVRKSGESEAEPSFGPFHSGPEPYETISEAKIAHQDCETVSETQIAHQAFTGAEAPSNIELSNGSKKLSETGADIAHHPFTGTETPLNVELSDGSKKPLEVQAVPEDQPIRQETEKKDEENLESQLFLFGDSWSDPCLEFAFKTLTGAIPFEDNFSIPGYFQQQVDTSHIQTDDCLAFPEFSFPNIFQNEVSSDFDATGKPVSVQQLPANSTFPSPGNVGLPGCSSNAPRQPSLEANEEHQAKVTSRNQFADGRIFR